MSTKLKSSEILFVKSVKDGIPNRDPLRDSDARRIFPEADGRISLSDVSIKRDVRDFVQARYPEGGDNKDMFVFCREERTDNNKLLGRESLAKATLKNAGRDKDESMWQALMKSAFDIRTFGAVFSVKKQSFHQVGPIQFGWAHSMHPVETKYVQGTVVMPSKDAKASEAGGEESEGASQGTIWTTYTLPFAVFAMPGVVNASIAKDTGMSTDDMDVLLKSLWYGTLNRQARGRGMQKPLLLVHVEYKDDFFRIGYLEDQISLMPNESDAWLGDTPPSSIREVSLDINHLVQTLSENQDKIERIRFQMAVDIALEGSFQSLGNAQNLNL